MVLHPDKVFSVERVMNRRRKMTPTPATLLDRIQDQLVQEQRRRKVTNRYTALRAYERGSRGSY